jgi:F-type H+-transporting ATPase subunit b
MASGRERKTRSRRWKAGSENMFTGLADPALWVAVAFFGFIAIIIYKKVPAMIGQSLDERGERINQEIEQARKLRDEAEEVLTQYQLKLRDAEKEAANIVEMAEREARALAAETEEKLTLALERRTRQAEEKIRRAKMQAIGEVRSVASEISVKAVEKLVHENGPGPGHNDMVMQAINAIPESFSRQ